MYYLHSASRVTYQSLAMPLQGRYTPADRPRNELEGLGEEDEEKTVQTPQYSLIHQSDTAMPNGEDAIVLTVLMLLFTEAVPPGSAFYIPEERHAEVLEASRGSRTTVVYQYYNPVTVVCTSWTRHAIRGGVVGRSCSGPFNQS